MNSSRKNPSLAESMEVPDNDRMNYIVSCLEVALALCFIMNGNTIVNTTNLGERI